VIDEVPCDGNSNAQLPAVAAGKRHCRTTKPHTALLSAVRAFKKSVATQAQMQVMMVVWGPLYSLRAAS
jgi:hypothetical protein